MTAWQDLVLVVSWASHSTQSSISKKILLCTWFESNCVTYSVTHKSKRLDMMRDFRPNFILHLKSVLKIFERRSVFLILTKKKHLKISLNLDWKVSDVSDKVSRWGDVTGKDVPGPGVIVYDVVLSLPQRGRLDGAPGNHLPSSCPHHPLILTYQIFLVQPQFVKSVHLFFTSVSKNLEKDNKSWLFTDYFSNNLS